MYHNSLANLFNFILTECLELEPEKLVKHSSIFDEKTALSENFLWGSLLKRYICVWYYTVVHWRQMASPLLLHDPKNTTTYSRILSIAVHLQQKLGFKEKEQNKAKNSANMVIPRAPCSTAFVQFLNMTETCNRSLSFHVLTACINRNTIVGVLQQIEKTFPCFLSWRLFASELCWI